MSRILVAAGVLLAGACGLALFVPPIAHAILQLASSVIGSPVGETWAHTVRLWFADGILLGAAIAAAGALSRRQDLVARLTATSRARVWTGIVATLAVQCVSMWFRRSAIVGGRRVWFLDDDPMISMRYGANLADGLGLVWNAGERVEGYTNFLWTCVMAAVHWVGFGRDSASAIILMINVGMSCALLVYVDRLLRALRVPGSFALVGLLLCVASRELLAWSVSGFEVIALALLFTVAIAGIVESSGAAPASSVLAVALLPLVRADGIVLAAFAPTVAVLVGKRRAAFALGGVALAVFAVHVGFRVSYYGEWVPNTARLKVAQWGGRLAHGAAYEWAFVTAHFAAVAFAVVAVVRSRMAIVRALAAAVVIQFGYVWCIGGDAFLGARFLAPIMPVLFCLAVLGVASVSTERTWQRIAAIALVVLTPLLFPNRFLSRLPTFVPALNAHGGELANLELGEWLRENTPPDAVVGDYWAGAVFYFSERRGVDFLGKMDPVIARSPAVCDGGPPGHNKFNFDHSLTALQPDFVVAGFKVHEGGRMTGPSGEPMPAGDLSGCRMFAALYEHPEFRARYLPNVAGNAGWRTVFRRVD